MVMVDNPTTNPAFKIVGDREFRFQGRLYDIVSQTTRGTTTWFLCYNDTREEKLIAGFRKVQDLNPGYAGNPRSKHILAILYHLVTLAMVEYPTLLHPPQSSEIDFGSYTVLSISIPSAPESPPPELS